MEEEDSPSILDAAEAMEPDSEKSETGDESPSEEETPAEEVANAEPVEESDDSGTADADYQSMTVAELKDLLKAAGKPVSGKKADLIARLQE